jgi:hypothetical protein
VLWALPILFWFGFGSLGLSVVVFGYNSGTKQRP